jgi:hypothetical protein
VNATTQGGEYGLKLTWGTPGLQTVPLRVRPSAARTLVGVDDGAVGGATDEADAEGGAGVEVEAGRAADATPVVVGWAGSAKVVPGTPGAATAAGAPGGAGPEDVGLTLGSTATAASHTTPAATKNR